MARTCKCGAEVEGPLCQHCDTAQPCVDHHARKIKSCQACLNIDHVCPICNAVRPSVIGATTCEKADRVIEIKQAKESA